MSYQRFTIGSSRKKKRWKCEKSGAPILTRRLHKSNELGFAGRIVYVLFFLSGAAALIYEISWSRQIGLLFGHTAHAAAVVLASYFAGLAIGYLIGAQWPSGLSPLLGYGLAELVVAVWACAVPAILNWSESTAFCALLSSPSFGLQTSARAAFCLLLLLPGTVALGATLPLMAEFFGPTHGVAASRIALAYALNTAGALVGVLSATFLLLVVVGVRTSSYLAAGLSAACGLTACLLARSRGPNGAGARLAPDDRYRHGVTRTTGQANPAQTRFWLGVAALSGFGTLALEVLYTRMFSLVFHNSIYTFGAVVATFLAALSLAAALVSRLQRRFSVDSLAAWSAMGGALATAFSVVLFAALTDLEYRPYGQSFAVYIGGAFALVAVVVLPPVTLLGMLLPLAWNALGSQDAGAGKAVGRLTAINTSAAAAGALSASFLLSPWLGLWPSFVLLAIPFHLAGLRLLKRKKQRLLAFGGTVVLAGLAVLAVRSPVDASHSGSRNREQIVHRWHSPYGWIDVVKTGKTGSFKVRQNLHYQFGETGTRAREYRQANLPLLLHKEPQDVLFLGLGTGLTAGGAIPHGEVKHVVVVELIPEVVDAARQLAAFNFGVVDHPKVEICVDDARHYLRATGRRFDVIVSDLFVPWESETGYLYTVEHYRVARARLQPGGLFCQWLPLYQVGVREFELIADSFATEFPTTTLWWGQMEADKPIVALVGSNRPLEMAEEKVTSRLNALRQQAPADDVLNTTMQLHDLYIGDWSPRNPNWLNTDEHPRVEFLTPISHCGGELINGLVLLEYFNHVLSKLPSRDVRFRSSSLQQPRTPAQRRAWHRLVLFGQ